MNYSNISDVLNYNVRKGLITANDISFAERFMAYSNFRYIHNEFIRSTDRVVTAAISHPNGEETMAEIALALLNANIVAEVTGSIQALTNVVLQRFNHIDDVFNEVPTTNIKRHTPMLHILIAANIAEHVHLQVSHVINKNESLSYQLCQHSIYAAQGVDYLCNAAGIPLSTIFMDENDMTRTGIFKKFLLGVGRNEAPIVNKNMVHIRSIANISTLYLSRKCQYLYTSNLTQPAHVYYDDMRNCSISRTCIINDMLTSDRKVSLKNIKYTKLESHVQNIDEFIFASEHFLLNEANGIEILKNISCIAEQDVSFSRLCRLNIDKTVFNEYPLYMPRWNSRSARMSLRCYGATLNAIMSLGVWNNPMVKNVINDSCCETIFALRSNGIIEETQDVRIFNRSAYQSTENVEHLFTSMKYTYNIIDLSVSPMVQHENHIALGDNVDFNVMLRLPVTEIKQPTTPITSTNQAAAKQNEQRERIINAVEKGHEMNSVSNWLN